MKKEIFEALENLSPNTNNDTTIPGKSPDVEIDGNIAFCLNTMMNTVGQKMDLSPKDMFEKIVSTGIASLLNELPEQTKQLLGLNNAKPVRPKTVTRNYNEKVDDEDAKIAAKAQQEAYSKMNESYGYTPMTSHAVTPGNEKEGSKGKSTRSGERSGRPAGRPVRKKKYKKNPRKRYGERGSERGSERGGERGGSQSRPSRHR